MTKTKRTPDETWKALEETARQEEIARFAAMPRAEVDRRLREAGEDPAALRAEGVALAERLRADRVRLAWQAEAAEGLARARAEFEARTPKYAGVGRDALLARLAALRASPRFVSPPALLFRNRSTEEASDDELRALVEELEDLEERGS